jgi:hypothetical protein
LSNLSEIEKTYSKEDDSEFLKQCGFNSGKCVSKCFKCEEIMSGVDSCHLCKECAVDSYNKKIEELRKNGPWTLSINFNYNYEKIRNI